MRRSQSRAERLVRYVQELERLTALRKLAAEDLRACFDTAKSEGFDTATLKVVLKLRTMTPDQRRERRALESIYLAALGMLDGESLPDEARRRLDPSTPTPPPPPDEDTAAAPSAIVPPAPRPEQPPLALKDPAEAREEGVAAAAAGKRVYDNPYPAGDPCRAAWDEGWCAGKKSHGMDVPEAYQRRTAKPPDEATGDAADAAPPEKKGRRR